MKLTQPCLALGHACSPELLLPLYLLPPAPLTWRGAASQSLSVPSFPKTRSKISMKLHQDPGPGASSCSPAPSLCLLALARGSVLGVS